MKERAQKTNYVLLSPPSFPRCESSYLSVRFPISPAHERNKIPTHPTGKRIQKVWSDGIPEGQFCKCHSRDFNSPLPSFSQCTVYKYNTAMVFEKLKFV